MSDTIIDVTPETDFMISTKDGDHDKQSHYCNKADIMRALVDGTAVVALCGKTWLPTEFDTARGKCQTCKELFERMNG